MGGGSERIGSVLTRLAVLLIGAAWLALARVADAEEPPAKVIVFVPPPDLEAPIRDALTAQLSGVAAELVVEHFVSSSDTLRQRVEESRSMAAAHQAIGVFWLDAKSKDEWLVYLAEPAENRVLMRRIPIGPDGSVAGMETVAVITRESTSALLAGRTVGMTEVAVPGEPAPVPPPAPPTQKPIVVPQAPRKFRPVQGLLLGFSYYGDLYAKDSRWQSGIGLSAAYGLPNGLRFGGGFVFLQELDTEKQGLTFLVNRYPFSAEASYAYRRETWFASLVFRTTAELTSRHAVAVAPPARATSDATRAVVFLSPRLRFDYRLTEALSLFMAAGVDFALNGFSFVNRVDGVDQAVFEPLRIRPGGEVGVAFLP